MLAARHEPPVVIVVHLHTPLSVFVESSLLVVGIALAVLCASRSRRTSDRSWIVLAVAAVALALVSAAGLVLYMVGSVG
ncbi:hypothetical protein GCM10025783_08550 [Amnibacterium soli]|uniref:Uncharacterized protein n=1 Tax=Amnibacterium soli TaxID=1282736 RepID=A0ABP8YWY5_9MICO